MDRDVGAAGGERQGDRAADPDPRPRDESRLAGQGEFGHREIVTFRRRGA
jgi:hypothetical protein